MATAQIDKAYADSATQTEVNSARVVSSSEDLPHETSDTSSLSMQSCIEHTFCSSKSLPSSEEKLVNSSPPATIQTSTRFLKHQQILSRRPAGSQTLKSAAARIVSLPETVSEYSEKKVLAKTKTRVVSMPQPLDIANSSNSFSDGLSLEHFMEDIEMPRRVRVNSAATETTHTPSPPSSPDSVVFIDNKSPLPAGFLRKRARDNMSPLSTQEEEDESWNSWSQSPPRPIPALHGPLSLPYARCPSGAEGTIIEEPENLSRMIWGLEGDETTRRSRPEQAQDHPAPAQAPTRKAPTRSTANYQVPPRFHNKKANEEPEAPQHATPFIAPLRAPQVCTQAPIFQYAPKPNKRALVPDHGPIDLTELVKPPSETLRVLPQDMNFSGSAAPGTFGFGSSTWSGTGDTELDWQSLLLAQERLRHSMFDPFSSSNADFNNYAGVSGNTSASLPSLVTSRTPIILDPPSYLSQSSRTAFSQYSPVSSVDTPMTQYTPASTYDIPQRMSALEIAQHYHQQQQVQHKPTQSLLPTPPNSSSPLWSSGFSPQASLWSPEMTAAHPWPDTRSKKEQVYSTPFMRHPEVFQQSRRADNGQYGQPRLPVRQAQPVTQTRSLVHSPANTRETGSNLNALPRYNANPLDAHLLDAMGRLSIIQPATRLLSQNSPAMEQQRSPVQPRPPPNTPYTSTTAHQKRPEVSFEPGLATPPSPTSPQQPRTRSISHQLPRSIPLARLVQRRLSSVPEEDNSIISEHSAPAASPHKTLSQLSSSVSAPAGLNTLAGPKSRAEKYYVPAVPTVPIAEAPKANQVNADRASDAASKDPSSFRSQRGGRGRGRGGRRPRGKTTGHIASGPERVDGGMTVRS